MTEPITPCPACGRKPELQFYERTTFPQTLRSYGLYRCRMSGHHYLSGPAYESPILAATRDDVEPGARDAWNAFIAKIRS